MQHKAVIFKTVVCYQLFQLYLTIRIALRVHAGIAMCWILTFWQTPYIKKKQGRAATSHYFYNW